MEDSGESNRDDDSYWKGGMIDFNKQDPSLPVAKRFGVGWTFNFANPFSWAIVGTASIFGIIIVAIAS